MSTIWLFIFALAICSFAHAEDYDYDELGMKSCIQSVPQNCADCEKMGAKCVKKNGTRRSMCKHETIWISYFW